MSMRWLKESWLGSSIWYNINSYLDESGSYMDSVGVTTHQEPVIPIQTQTPAYQEWINRPPIFMPTDWSATEPQSIDVRIDGFFIEPRPAIFRREVTSYGGTSNVDIHWPSDK